MIDIFKDKKLNSTIVDLIKKTNTQQSEIKKLNEQLAKQGEKK